MGDIALASAQPGPLIFKPNAGAGGDGVVVVSSGSELQSKLRVASSARYWLASDTGLDGLGAVVQEYICNPLLLQGFKWDIRVYAVVLSLQPLRVLLCKEGLARICTEAYVAPTLKTAHKVASHLTNYSIGKYAIDFDHHDDPLDGTRGSKRTLSSTLAFLQTQGHDVYNLQAQIHHIVAATTEAIATKLSSSDMMQHSCFHILGFDIMFDDCGQAWLLEVNTSPSLSIDSVYPTTGPHARDPKDPPEDAVYAPLVMAAKASMGSKATRICKCCSHHRPHLHAPCAVDLIAKTACVTSVLEVVRRDMSHGLGRPLSCTELTAGTDLLVVHDGGS